MDGREIARRIELLAGVGLVAFGGVFALVVLVGGDDGWGLVWPLFVIIPGVLLFAATFAFGRGGGFLAIPAAILTVGGLLLLLTNTLGIWAAWVYLWPLLTPGAVGLGLLVFGARSGVPQLKRVGLWLGAVGLALFAVLGAVFERALGVSGPFGPEAGRIVWPVLLILGGLWLIVAWSRRP